MKRIFLYFFLFIFASSLFAQYSSDAMLIEKFNDNVALIQVSGISNNKKNAIEYAKKSAIYTYLFNGIAGLNNDQPLLGNNPSEKANKYVDELFNSGRYAIFIKSEVVDDENSRKVQKLFQAVIKIELYTKSLLNDLKNQGVNVPPTALGGASGVDNVIAIPSIMVVPYCVNGESFQDKIQSNPYIRMAISKVNSGFVKQGAETKDLEQMMRNSDLQQGMNMDMSFNDMVLNGCGADVAVYVDINENTNSNGTSVTLMLNAIDISTSDTYATASQVTPHKRASVDMITNALVDVMVNGFLDQLTAAFARKIDRGNSISVVLNISPMSSVTFDYEVEDFTPLRDALHIWMRKNALNGKFHVQGSTKNMMVLDEIQVPNKDENGLDMDVNDFALKLYRYLRTQGLQVERTVLNNRITITIM